jgi:hypothetical protein
MFSRGVLKAAQTAFAVAVVAVAMGTPLSASAATWPVASAAMSPNTASGTFRIFQMINGFKVCLDAGFEFSVCQTGSSPDDPSSLEKWALVPQANGTVQIKNGSDCLDVTMFTAPCTQGDGSQQWVRVSVGNGTVKVENTSPTTKQCLDSMWTFKTCTQGDKQQIWTFKHRL